MKMTDEVSKAKVGDKVSYCAIPKMTQGCSGEGIVSKVGRVNISIDISHDMYGSMTLKFRKDDIKVLIIHGNN